MATAAERRADQRAKRRKERTKTRQAERAKTRRGTGLLSGIGARLQQRHTARQKRRQTRVEGTVDRRSQRLGEVTARQAARAERRASVIQSKSEGGAFDPESIAARWAGITGTVEAGSDAFGTVAGALSGTGGATDALGALTGLFPDEDELTDEGELIELFPDEDAGADWIFPVGIGVAALAAFLLLRPKKKDEK